MAEFNKGYYRRQGRVEGIYLERERIIKLLENEQMLYEEFDGEELVISKLIALIKGKAE